VDEQLRQVRIRQLWEMSVYGGNPEPIDAERCAAATSKLATLRDTATDAMSRGDIAAASNAYQNGLRVWMLLSLEVASWLHVDRVESMVDGMGDWKQSDQQLELLFRLKSFNECMPPQHRQAMDPMPILLDRKLFEALGTALAALRQGEVQDIVRPAETGRHDDAYTWDLMRIRALEWVAFTK
jgi:hypothetical protein